MLKIKSIGRSFYNRAYNYNLCIPTEHDYDNYSEDPIISIKEQKYATRLYTLLFIDKSSFLTKRDRERIARK